MLELPLLEVLQFSPALGMMRCFPFFLQMTSDLVMVSSSSSESSTSELTVCAMSSGQGEGAELGDWLDSMGYSSQLSISRISLMLAVSEASCPSLMPLALWSKEEPRLLLLLLSVPEAQFLRSAMRFSIAMFSRMLPRMVSMDRSLHLQQSCSFYLLAFPRRTSSDRSVSSCSSIHPSGSAELMSFSRGRSQRVEQKVSMMAKSCLALTVWACVMCVVWAAGCWAVSELACVRWWLVRAVVRWLFDVLSLLALSDLLTARFI